MLSIVFEGRARHRRLSIYVQSLLLVVSFVFSGYALAAPSRDHGHPGGSIDSTVVNLLIDPRTIAEAAEVWALIGNRENPIWPGWDASDTPILLYLPGEQDVLINHPRPPDGFVPYEGPVRFPAGGILVRDGETIFALDGQNTSSDINGVQTLVVADALSNLRQQVRGMLEDPRPAAEKARELAFSQLTADPYAQLMLIVHEAFHVFQDRTAPDKGANEMLLLYYPTLSVENNVGFALEGKALAAALSASDETAFKAAVVRWLAVREERRSKLRPQAVEYEDGVEFGEGLANYAEYKLLESLEGRTPSLEMWWIQGFHGYDSLAPQRQELIATMLKHMRGEISVNNDPYGTAPLRMRLYYSGMAIAAVLDRLSSDWKDRIFEPEASPAGLVKAAVGATEGDLWAALEEARQDPEYGTLVDAKSRLAREGRARIDSMVVQIERGTGTGVTIRYGALETPRVALGFTPFGITVVDDDRTIYGQVPIAAHFPDGSEVTQTEPMPVLHDKKQKTIRFRLPAKVRHEDIAGISGHGASTEGSRGELRLELPGVLVTSPSAILEWKEGKLTIVLVPQRK